MLLFGSTHAALAAEEAIIAGGFWCDVVPRPPGTSDDLCGLAVEVDRDDATGVGGVLRDAGIDFEAYYGDGADGA